MWFEVCVACLCLVLDSTDRVVLTMTNKCCVMPICTCSTSILEGAALNLVFCFLCLSPPLPPTFQLSAMAEHLGIEFMGMEQSILILSASIATKMSFILTLLVFRLWCDHIVPRLTSRSLKQSCHDLLWRRTLSQCN